MTKLIDSSRELGAIEIIRFAGKLVSIRVTSGKTRTEYDATNLVSIVPIDVDAYRSAGKAAAGAIIGDVLTGGVGLIAGPAIGGRRRKTGSYLIHFSDGHYIAIEETDKGNTALLDDAITRAKNSDMVKSAPPPDLQGSTSIPPLTPPVTKQTSKKVKIFYSGWGLLQSFRQ
ncbi:hypothetical protein [Rhodobacter sp. 24-YEA-8]|uniref:hypothetical protein n=1 Tax=Rhodobacter sp. 24-YEA-8 TaxID=1884310 RepID=UPI0008972E16|nr:hypothetical protein [Rhodobacter sp. 24-YEA-8]SEB50729.1 hypothetical protein SAMN05519105_0562 [Rhodobacter sp. 24-YEA-8]